MGRGGSHQADMNLRPARPARPAATASYLPQQLRPRPEWKQQLPRVGLGIAVLKGVGGSPVPPPTPPRNPPAYTWKCSLRSLQGRRICSFERSLGAWRLAGCASACCCPTELRPSRECQRCSFFKLLALPDGCRVTHHLRMGHCSLQLLTDTDQIFRSVLIRFFFFPLRCRRWSVGRDQ